MSTHLLRLAAENAIVEQSKSSGASVDVDAAIFQHQEMVAALEGEGVTCHFLEPDEHLPLQTFARDSGIMTPWGMLVAQMARPERTSRRKKWAGTRILRTLQPSPLSKISPPILSCPSGNGTAAPVEGGGCPDPQRGGDYHWCEWVRTFSKGADQVARWVGGTSSSMWVTGMCCGWAATLPRSAMTLSCLQNSSPRSTRGLVPTDLRCWSRIYNSSC
ncbi:MAG: hypothetical protein EOR48_09935 [Mesorhizobium sp.]|nr:MAG: hypothetical protein EOR48_09935 [Mesorhizobium sp.]